MKTRRPVRVRKSSPLEDAFARQVQLIGLPAPVAEFKFHAERRWRFDFAYPEQRIAVEIEGGVWSGGRHTRGAGFEADAEKYATALVDGWRVLRVTGKQIASGQAVTWLEGVLGAAGGPLAGQTRPTRQSTTPGGSEGRKNDSTQFGEVIS